MYLIADEVMSGFGRCGEWFAWQRYGSANRPDIMTLAKGLTAAHMPLGAVVVSPAIARILEGQTLMTGLTYSGHPLACAAGVAALESYAAEDLIARSRALGACLLHVSGSFSPGIPSSVTCVAETACSPCSNWCATARAASRWRHGRRCTRACATCCGRPVRGRFLCRPR